ncbi:metal-dependent hydrolase [Flavobacterium agricola]|uniref:Metal-dependent hydrolase n=1 Tax=Flavobacterium agricola TaxID=2870839 RepID=A0ABY6M2J6_9FLAO|nr:metal-dependent hydrolase [Flavobacterium agricola]UYW01869.1 metal-dependent hydrolase [Flavobacterium agricola]
MDSLTQIAVGIATAELCLGKQLKNKAFLYGAVIATLPDLDIYLGKLFDPITAIAMHRSFSHSILFFLLASVPIGAIMFKLEKGHVKLFQAINASFFILFTHSLLDAFTTWGTQIFWPLPYRAAIKSIFVVDFFYTIPWLIFLFLVYKNSNPIKRAKWLKIGFVITSCYLLLGIVLKIYVTQQVKNALHGQNITYTKIIVKPTFSNVVLWNINVMTNDAFLLSDFSVFDAQPMPFKSYDRNLYLAEPYQMQPVYNQLVNISEGWFTLQQTEQGILFNDLRFGLLKDDATKPQFAFSYKLMESESGLTAEELPKDNRDGKALLQNLYNRIFTSVTQ